MKPEEIKKKRKALGLSQQQLAEETGFGVASIKRWESGNSQPTEANARRLRQHLQPNPMKGFRERLSGLGIKRKFLNEIILPDWWSDSMGNEPNGLLLAAGYVADYLGVKRSELLKEDLKGFSFVSGTGSVRYKAPSNKQPVTQEREDSLRLATSISYQAAAYTGDAVIGETADLPDPDDLRKQLLNRGEHRWVSLDDLLHACWSHGIGVIHLNKRAFPTGTVKPDALAAWSGLKRVIVLIKEQHSASWLSYTLAHELGHFFHGHIPEGDFYLDQSLQAERIGKEEQEADDYAMRLLTGEPDLGIYIPYRPKSADLAERARHYSRRYRVAPGVVALNYGMSTGNWGIANGAVRIVDENRKALRLVQEYRDQQLDWDALSEERREWIRRIS
ncbi:MAG: XRE family transcriptional regulator, partial [Verrucomicrobiales bacterium]|nr:XRE family transcriptional regulator [Verrucomicrobiales bacterium]